MEVRSDSGELLIIDAGSGIRRLGNLLVEENRCDLSMLFTHSHWDHVLGFPFFKPVFSEKTRLSVYGCSFLEEDLRERLQVVMHAPYFPIDFGLLPSTIEFAEASANTCAIRGFEVTPIPISHPNQGQGYRINQAGKTFVFLTDNELTYKHEGGLDRREYVDFCRGADLLLHDAEFNSDEYEDRTRGWGHSRWDSALELAIESGVKSFGLYHHNQDRHDEELDWIVSECRRIVAERGVDLECFAVRQDDVYEL
jgi:ribonuclease BN (tRNA processing enzyme)